MAVDKDQVRAKLARAPSRHAAADAERLGLVGRGEHDAAADRDRFAAQERVEQLLDRCVEGVEVGVEDGGRRVHAELFAATLMSIPDKRTKQEHLMNRRELLLGLAALPAASRIAAAQTYPARPVRILVATSAGGGTDLVARFIAQWLTERLGQSFVVENRPGGGNNIGTEMAARAPADGHTLFMANTVNTINNSLYQKLNYNFIADFAPVANVMGTPLLVLVHPSVEAKNAAELIALAKASPGKLNLASGGIGSTGHMSAELLQMMAGIKFTHVPYRGEAPALTDLIAGQAQVMVSTTGSSLQYAKAGTLRALATTTDDRVAELPDLPPLSKTVPGYQANAWNGLCAPKGTPAEIIALLNKEVNLAMADPKIKERMASLGGVALPGSPEDYGRTIAADTEKWARVVRFSGAQVN